MKRGRGTDGETVTGGRAATVRHVFGERVLSICMPTNKDHPKGWRWVALSDVAQMESGHTPSRNHPEYWGGDIPWISVKDARLAHGKRLSETEEYTNSLGIANSSARLLPAGTVCLSRGGTVGYVVILDRPMATSQGFANWICGPQLIPEFLQYLLLAEADALEKFSIGTTIKTIYYPDLKAFHVCLPPLAEQKRIVALLDEAFAGIDEAKAKTEDILERTQALFESHLQSIFSQRGHGWVERRLGELSRINYGYTESASSEKVGPHFLRITDIQDDGVDWNTVPYCPIDKGDLPKYKLTDGDIVFARTGATTGKSYLVSNPPDSVFASYLIRVQLSDKALIPGFLYLFFQTRSYWDVIRAGVSGSAQGGFNASKLGELTIPYPASLNDQKAVIHSIAEIQADTLKAGKLSNRKLQALGELRESLLTQAFAGELTA